MRDINIQVKENHTVDFENDYAGLNRENLQGNIIFNFDKFISGQARVEIVINNVSGYINVDQVEQTYILPIKSSLLTGNDILMQLVIDEPATYNLTTDTDIDTKKIYYEKVGDNYVQVEHPRKADLGNYYEASIPVWKSETFYLKVGFSINAEETIPEQYPSWIETLNNLINETESAIEQASNVNISAIQTQSGATITITNKDGESNSVNITNGADGTDGKDAKINGYNTITIQEGTNIGIEQNGEILTINNTYDDTSIKNDITTLQNTKANKSELSVYSLITETGAKIDLEINSTTYVLTAKLYDKNNVLLSTSTGIDLPLETMVVGASYDSETKEIVLTLKNGQTVRFSVADLVSGLQTEITPSNKLASDLVDDTNQTHKFVSQSEKTQITTNATNITSLQNNKEDKSNKVTSISSSSTDTQYPSAKCMYDSQVAQDELITELEQENELLLDQIPKGTATGQDITLNDSSNLPIKSIEISGNTSQDTLTGKNLLSNSLASMKTNNTTGTWNNNAYTLNGITWTPVYENGLLKYINANGTATAESNFIVGEAPLIEGTSYTGTGCPSGGSTTTYRIFYSYIGGDYGTGVMLTVTATTSSLATARVYNGATASNLKFYPMVKLSSITDATYEPYCGGIPAPNPSYPQEVKVVKGDNVITEYGKNLLQKQGYGTPNTDSGYWEGNPTFLTSSDNGWGTIAFNNSTGSSAAYKNMMIKNGNVNYKPSTNYTIFVELKDLSTDGATGDMIFLSQGANTRDPFSSGEKKITYTEATNKVYRFNVTTKADLTDTYAFRTFAMIPAGKNVSFKIRAMIVEGNYELDTYLPYIETNYELNLGVRNIATTYSISGSGYINWSFDNSKATKKMTFSFVPNFTINNATIYMRSNISGTLITLGVIPNLVNGEKASISFELTDAQLSEIKGTTGGYVQVYRINVEMTQNSISNVQLEEGTIAHSYSEYGVEPLELCKIGNYKDIFVKSNNNNKWYKKAYIGKVSLENYTFGRYNTDIPNLVRRTTTQIPNIKYVSVNTELGVGIAQKYLNHTGTGMSGAGAQNHFAIDTAMFQVTLLDGENPSGLFYYALANHEYTLCNDTLQTQLDAIWNMKTNKNVTNISITADDLKPYLDIVYRKDLETLFNNL